MKTKSLSSIKMAAAISIFLLAWTGKGLGQSFDDGYLRFIPIEDTYTASVAGYNSDYPDIPSDIVIPSFAIDPETGYSYEVVSIHDNAFMANEYGGPTSVVLPETVTVIGEGAFSWCANLLSINIPQSVTTIMGGAFLGCSGLTGEFSFTNSVSFIGWSAFSGCSGITSFVIPSSVTWIGDNAFANCSSVEQVYFNANINYEGHSGEGSGLDYPYQAFSECNGALVVGSNVRSIPNHLFENCGFTSITFENGLTSIQEYAFYNSVNLTGDLVIPSSVTTIKESAFENCSGFNGQLVLPSSIISLGNCAFKYCSNFTSIDYNIITGADYSLIIYSPFYRCGGSLVVGDGVLRIPVYTFCDSDISSAIINAKNIGNYAFADCFVMNELTLGESVSSIGKGAFNYAEGLSTIHYLCRNCSCDTEESPFRYYCKGTIEIGESVTAIPAYMFYSFYNNPDEYGFTGELTIPNSVHSIGSFAFCNNKFTGRLVIPDSVTTIGSSAFSRCEGFTSLKIGESVTSIGSFAFIDCSGFSYSLNIPDAVTSIGMAAFSHCSSFTSLHIGQSVNMIGDEAFGHTRFASIDVSQYNQHYNDGSSNQTTPSRESCNALIETSSNKLILGCKNTIIPTFVTSIGNYAFSGCDELQAIDIPNTVSSIGDYAFSGCSELQSLEIPESVTSLNEGVLSSCIALTDIFIPDAVTLIGAGAFSNCISLTTISIPNAVTSIGAGAFSNCIGLTSVSIPNAVISIGENAFNGCTGLTGMVIPNSVTVIGSRAFQYCSGLTSVVVPNLVTSIEEATFYGCSSLTSVTLGHSVTSIDLFAFHYCDNLNTLNVLAETPPSLPSFYEVFGELEPSSILVKVPCGSLEDYQEAEGWNIFTNIQENCGMILQPVALAAGTNWFSSNVEINLAQLEDAIVAAMTNATGTTIKAKDGKTTTYNGSRWRGTLTSIDVAQMYKITVASVCEITLEGEPINPTEHPVTIQTNATTWIGYPLDQSMTVTDAFAGFNAVSGDQIKAKDGKSTSFNGTRWRGTLTNLEPGKGYVFSSSSTQDRTLVFPSSK